MAVRCFRRAILATTIHHILQIPIASSSFAFRRPIHSAPVLQMTSSVDTPEKTYIDKIALILINCHRQQLVARSYDRAVFYTPGGKREPGESDKEALLRECMEELSVDLLTSTETPATIQSFGTFEAQAYGKSEGTKVRLSCFRVTPRDAELELEHMVKASEEVEELKWIDSSFDREKLTVTGIMILDDLKRKGLID